MFPLCAAEMSSVGGGGTAADVADTLSILSKLVTLTMVDFRPTFLR